MFNIAMLAAIGDYFPMPWLQIPGLILVIGLVIGWVVYRRKQM